MKIIISPNDVLLFREAKQFDAGETHVARSILPAPQALAGAIRSKILVDSDFSKVEIVGYKKEEPEFEILGSFFYDGQECFRTPLDIAKSKDDDEYFYITPRELHWGYLFSIAHKFEKELDSGSISEELKQKFGENGFSLSDDATVKKKEEKNWERSDEKKFIIRKEDGKLNIYHCLVLFGGKRLHTEGGNGYLSYENMIAYLSGTLEEKNLTKAVVESEDLFKKESRIGIKLDAAKTTEEGYFYKVEFLRLNQDLKSNKDTKLALWLGEKADDLEPHLGTSGILKLGGESRFVNYELKEDVLLTHFQNQWEGIKDTINRDKKFKLYIATIALTKQFLFCWDTVHINGSERLLRFLMDDLDIDWAKDARILLSEVYKTIRIFTDHEKAIKIDIKDEKKATLKISNGISHGLTVKKENGKLNVYAKKFTWDIERIIKQKLGIEPLNIYPLIGKPYLISGWDYANNKPKGNKYGIPEGSVYFVDFEGEFNCAKPYLKFGELNKLGYGLAFFGVWRGDRKVLGDDRNV